MAQKDHRAALFRIIRGTLLSNKNPSFWMDARIIRVRLTTTVPEFYRTLGVTQLAGGYRVPDLYCNKHHIVPSGLSYLLTSPNFGKTFMLTNYI